MEFIKVFVYADYFAGAAALIIRNTVRIISLAHIELTNAHLYSAGFSVLVLSSRMFGSEPRDRTNTILRRI